MDHRGRGSRPARLAGTALVVGLVTFGAGCGTTDEASRQTLPPIRSTVATTTTTSTTIPPGQRFYTVQSGDTLGKIAERFEVPVQAIVDANGLASPDDIQAGQTLEIPSGVTLITELPPGPGTSAP
jgi:LysM repeat protein